MNPEVPRPEGAGPPPEEPVQPPSHAPVAIQIADPADSPAPFIPAPEQGADRWAHRRAEPRPLALLWTIFLAAATLIMLTSLVMYGGADHDIYRPAARGLLAVTAVGMTILWPMVRLSQTAPPEGARAAVAKDLVVILAPVQAVLWPQMFFVLAYWPVAVVAALAAMLLAWTLLIGAVVCFGLQAAGAQPARAGLSRASARSLWMAVIVVLVAGGPLIGLLARPTPSSDDQGLVSAWALTSPITSVFEIARDRPWSGAAAEAKPAHWAAIVIIGGVGLLAWGAVLAIPRRRDEFSLSRETPGGVV